MGLYRYVAGKEELVEALLDRVLGRMPAVPETADPLADLGAFATAHRDLLLAHPWAVPGLIAHPLPGPNALPDRRAGAAAPAPRWASTAIGRSRPSAGSSRSTTAGCRSRSRAARPRRRRAWSGSPQDRAADFPVHGRGRRGDGAIRQRRPLRHRADELLDGLAGGADLAAPSSDGRASELGEQRHELRERAGAMRVRVLLVGRPLARRCAPRRRLTVGDEDRVVAEAALARRRGREPARPPALDDLLRRRVAGHDERDRRDELRGAVRIADVGRAGRAAGARLAAASFACPAQYAENTPGAPPSTSTQMPESSASAGRPVCAAAARALMSAFSANVTPSSTGSGPS